MSKDFKVRRYGRDRRRQRKVNAAKVILLVAVIAAACLAGWYLYDPVSAWVSEKAAQWQLQREQREQERAQEQQNQQNQQGEPGGQEEPGTTPTLPTGEQGAFPAGSVVLDTALLYEPDALEQKLAALAAEGYTGAVFTLKDADGLVLYRSALEDVTQNTAQTAARYDLKSVIETIEAAGLTPIGRIWAFDDHTASRRMPDAMVKYNYTETNWIHNDKEAGGHSWLNPVSSRAQEYILSLLREAADSGLSAILLEGVQFPTGYSLELATYAEKGVTVDQSAVLADFAGSAAAEMRQRGVSLWTALWMGDLSGESVRLGSDPMKVLSAAEHCVIKAAPEQFATKKAPLAEDIYTVMQARWAALTPKLPDGVTLAAEIQGDAPAAGLWQGAGWGETQVADQIRAAEQAGVKGILLAEGR